MSARRGLRKCNHWSREGISQRDLTQTFWIHRRRSILGCRDMSYSYMYIGSEETSLRLFVPQRVTELQYLHRPMESEC